MGLTLLRFLFDADPPSLRAVYDGVCERSEEPVRFVDRRHKGASLVVARKFDCVGLIRNERIIEVHGMLGAGLVTPVRETLRAAGGQHPLPQRDPENPEYGEEWMGILAAGDDFSIRAGDRVFKIWSLYLTMDLLPAWDIADALDVLPRGESLVLDRAELQTRLAETSPVDPPNFPESRQVRDALLRFLSQAAARNVAALEIRESD